jgi:hypothetical protein
VPTVIRKDTEKINVSNTPGTPRRPPRPEAEVKLLKESINLLRGEAAPEKKTSSDWPLLRIVRKTRMDQAPSYWVPRSLWP